MTRPFTLDVPMTANMLHVPERFVGSLQEHGMLPKCDPDGCIPVRSLEAYRRRLPWLDRLDVPMTEGELRRLVHSDLRIPVSAGVGLRAAGGRRMVQPWRLLDWYWSGTHALQV